MGPPAAAFEVEAGTGTLPPAAALPLVRGLLSAAADTVPLARLAAEGDAALTALDRLFGDELPVGDATSAATLGFLTGLPGAPGKLALRAATEAAVPLASGTPLLGRRTGLLPLARLMLGLRSGVIAADASPAGGLMVLAFRAELPGLSPCAW